MRFIKESIGILIIVLFVIFIEIITENITNKSLDKINLKIQSLENSNNDIQKEVEEFSKVWEKEEKKLSCYMEHNELEEISKNVNNLVFLVQNKKMENIKEKINEIEFKMEHIKNKQRLKLENIF